MRRNCRESTLVKTDTEERDRTAFPAIPEQNLIFEALVPTRGVACLINSVHTNEFVLDVNQLLRRIVSTSRLRLKLASLSAKSSAMYRSKKDKSTS